MSDPETPEMPHAGPAAAGPPPVGGRDPFMIGLFLAVILGIAAFGVYLSKIAPPAPPELGEGATLLPEPLPLPDFRLVDHEGRPFERRDFQGQWSLVFFGYSSCPDVCPFVLGQLAQVKRRWSELDMDNEMPRVVFVSVDPERDSPERLREYVPFFDSGFRGVSGATDEIETLTRALGVFYALRRGADEDEDYLVDHAAKLWLIDPEARLAAVLDDPHEPDPFIELIERIRAIRGGLS